MMYFVDLQQQQPDKLTNCFKDDYFYLANQEDGNFPAKNALESSPLLNRHPSSNFGSSFAFC